MLLLTTAGKIYVTIEHQNVGQILHANMEGFHRDHHILQMGKDSLG